MVLTAGEKERLDAFLRDDSDPFTNGVSWYRNMIRWDNRELNFYTPDLKLPPSLTMPDYTKLPEKRVNEEYQIKTASNFLEKAGITP